MEAAQSDGDVQPLRPAQWAAGSICLWGSCWREA
jgi:hypothetical protein